MKFPKRILTKEIADWYEAHNLPAVRLEEIGKQHKVLPSQVQEAMVEVYHQYMADPEAIKPTRIAWMVWERAKGIQSRHHDIAIEIIRKLREENTSLRHKLRDIVLVLLIGFVFSYLLSIAVCVEMGLLK